MAKLSKREFKEQEIIFSLLKKEKLSEEEVWKIYEDINPGFIDNLQKGVYFTPIDMAADFALMSYRFGNIIDVCAGIGGLSYCMKLRDSYDKNISSLTCIELNPEFVEIGKKLLPEARWICGDAFDEKLWEELTLSGNNKIDCFISNPPFGKIKASEKTNWLNYKGGELELKVLELALRFSDNAYMILPSMSVEFRDCPVYNSYERIQRNKVDRFRKDVKQWFFQESMSIDCKIYSEGWKNLAGGISVECVEICMREEDYKPSVKPPGPENKSII